MGYCLTRDETVAAGVRRIALEQLDKAVRSLTKPDRGRHKGVHEARKACKKLRAVLRLSRGVLGKGTYRRENLFIRDAQRDLSGVRDTAAIIEALDKLTGHYAGQLAGQFDDDAFARLREILVERCRAIEAEQMVKADRPAEVSRRLDGARERIAHWDIGSKGSDSKGSGGKGFAALRPGLERIYRDGRRDLRRLTVDADAHAWHEWRKQVKYLWYDLRILCPMWPGPLDSLSGELEKLSDLLGHDHDLAVLSGIAAGSDLDRTAAAALAGLVERRCRALRDEALPIGARVYADRPKAFLNRFDAYWDAWHHEHPAVRRPGRKEERGAVHLPLVGTVSIPGPGPPAQTPAAE